ncbi:hypothetical protein ACYSNR_13760 [Enterococcus sp. LJL128]|uniref:hypothetical protein n=1 Tax=Enterococcus sp. LJL51 TaxID=3416656 RepID=UPI003CF44A89
MRTLVVFVIIFLLIAVQYQLGLHQKKIVGSFLPILFLVVSGWMYLADSTNFSLAVLVAPIAFIGVWYKGYLNSKKENQKRIDLMKAKDL